MSKYIMPLSEVGYGQVKLVGGKAASLGEMIKAKLPVPAGFVLTTEAYRLQDLKPLETEIYEAFDKLKAPRVAVRSSAVAEDSSDASWAGQLETVLNVKKADLLEAIMVCWRSMQSKRAQSYAADHHIPKSEQAVAVVVQAMVDSEVSGVMFTANPVTSNRHEIMIESIWGLGENLVQGIETPDNYILESKNGKLIAHTPHRQKTKLIYKSGKNTEQPLNKNERNSQTLTSLQLQDLAKVANAVEAYYGKPQDLEWALYQGELYLIQSRPITTLKANPIDTSQSLIKRLKVNFGKPDELFYWGPSRAKPLYMSDFMVAAEKFFVALAKDPKLPNPPQTLVLFHNNKMVWLNNAQGFSKFTKEAFETYQKLDLLESDVQKWRRAVKALDSKKADAAELVQAWMHTLFAEFALYGAESALAKTLKRFDDSTSRQIWGAFTVPDNLTFLSQIDEELLASNDPAKMAQKYPWIDDGYRGVSNNAIKYFTERLHTLRDSQEQGVEKRPNKAQMARDYKLSDQEVASLNLVRKLIEFMDDRKAWMMRTRRYITKMAGNVEHGWLFDDTSIKTMDAEMSRELWDRYVDYKATNRVLKGLVACNGGHHFANGVVQVVTNPTDNVADDQILAVPATSPSYIPLMRRARALITDHGGMMSHAAIVARELNLPCIVGTKHATKTLKNGDKVVLDLVKGNISK